MAYVPVKCPSCGKVNQFDSILNQAFCAYCGGKCTWSEEGPADLKEVTAKAEAGDVKAQYELAEIYRNGKGVVQDNYEALKWFTKAAEQGDPYAMYQLGIMYSSGLGTPRNCAKAVKYFSDAREHGLGKQQRGHRSRTRLQRALLTATIPISKSQLPLCLIQVHLPDLCLNNSDRIEISNIGGQWDPAWNGHR